MRIKIKRCYITKLQMSLGNEIVLVHKLDEKGEMKHVGNYSI